MKIKFTYKRSLNLSIIGMILSIPIIHMPLLFISSMFFGRLIEKYMGGIVAFVFIGFIFILPLILSLSGLFSVLLLAKEEREPTEKNEKRKRLTILFALLTIALFTISLIIFLPNLGA